MSATQTPEIVGYVDSLGFLKCSQCMKAHMDSCPICQEHRVPVYRDTSPHNPEPCDRCGRRLSEERT